MKPNAFGIGIVLSAVLFMAAAFDADAQRKKKTPDKSQGATVSQTIGVDTEITITYHRPGVRGRNVWVGSSEDSRIGPLVPHNGDPRPWRAGANEATTIEVSSDVTIEGQALAAGRYALFMIPTETEWTLIFNGKPKQWGSFRYKPEDDALKITVTPVEAPHEEWLKYGFDDAETHSATAFLHWEKKKVPFRIAVASGD